MMIHSMIMGILCICWRAWTGRERGRGRGREGELGNIIQEDLVLRF
jgi:hypothetical protein